MRCKPLLILTAGSALLAAPLAAENGPAQCQEGWDAFERSEYAVAVHDYRAALEQLDPTSAAFAECRSAMADALAESGETREAETILRDLLAHSRPVASDPVLGVTTSNRLVLVLLETGQLAEARARAAETLEALDSTPIENALVYGRARYNAAAGQVYAGEKAEAIEAARSLIADLEASGQADSRLAMRARNLLGYALGMDFRYDDAIATYRALLPDSAQVFGEQHREHLIFANNLASVLQITGRLDDAAPVLETIARTREERFGPTYRDTVVSYQNLARLYMRQDDYARAEPYVLRTVAGQRAQQAEATGGHATALFLLGEYLDQARGDRSAAIFAFKQGIEVLRKVQAGLTDETRSDFIRSWYRAYETLQGWMIEEGRLAEAETVGRILKRVEYDGFVRGENADLDSARAQLTQTEKKWEAGLARWAERPMLLARELSAMRKEPSPDAEQLAQLEKVYDEAYARYRDAIGEWLDGIAVLEDDAVRREARALDLDQSENLQATVAQLGDDVALLQVVALPDALHFFLISAHGFVHRARPTDRRELNMAIFEFREAIVAEGTADTVPASGEMTQTQSRGQDLYRLLVAPIEADLTDAGTRTLMLNLQGQLRYVPFAALFDGNQYLVERFEMARFNPAARTVFDGSPNLTQGNGFGLSRQVEGFSPLPEVPRELDAVITGSDGKGVLAGEFVLDEAFTRPALEAGLSRSAPILHLASHFAMNTGDASRSFLVLGDGSRLFLSDINRSSRLRFRGIELVTLSACQTGLAGNGSGLEVDGLGALIQNKGADAVLASLWSVEDRSTADLMIAFYRGLAQPGTSKAAALRAAQLAILSQEATSEPWYWAPFFLMGDWK